MNEDSYYAEVHSTTPCFCNSVTAYAMPICPSGKMRSETTLNTLNKISMSAFKLRLLKIGLDSEFVSYLDEQQTNFRKKKTVYNMNIFRRMIIKNFRSPLIPTNDLVSSHQKLTRLDIFLG